MRPEQTGQAGRDFSTVLSQAMLSKDWNSMNGLQRQGLADMGSQALDSAASRSAGPEPTSTGSATAITAAPPRNTSEAGMLRENARSPRNSTSGGHNTTGTHQELTQRALRTASLRAAQSRADGTASGRLSSVDGRPRKAGPRKDEDIKTGAASVNSMALPPSTQHRAVQEATQPVAADTAPTALSAMSVPEATAAAAATPATPMPVASAPGATTDIPTSAPALPPGSLTTVQLSPQMQIVTSGQGVVTEQSLQAFAQSMGIEASQFKQLASPALVGSVDASGLRAGVTTTDALTGTPILPAAPTDVTVLDLSQAVPAGLVLEDLHIDWMGGRRNAGIDASPSTLDVLGMRDGGLSADAVTSLQESADAGSQGQLSDNTGSGMGQPSLSAHARNPASASNATSAPATQNMAEHFEKLSAKLATEMAGRIHEQFSQGEWKMKFALKPASLGQVDVQLEMRDGKLAAVLQADNPMTQDLLQNGSQRLRDALSQMGLSQSSVSVGDGRGQSFQGDRQPGAQGMATASDQNTLHPDESVQSVASAPRRNSLSQLDFYA